ncbi:MAG: hypothetical protein KC496_05040 [Anaerolineae bacterium]|nr:hypothetical protein [Anaerolineae bacterium]
MPVQVVWDDDEKRILRQIYSGHVTLQDYYAATDQVAEMASQVSHVVHSVMDRSQIISTPNSALPALLYANKHLPENIELRLIICPSVYTRMITNIGRRIAPRVIHHIHFAATLAEAHQIIRQHMNVVDRLHQQIQG